MDKTTPAPTDRLRDATRTREAILRAAQNLFATKGYTTTGVRQIAADAGVNSALVRRYFGSKQGLLRAALEDVFRLDAMLTGERSTFGERAAAILLTAESIANPVAVMMLAMADREARDLCCLLVQEKVIIPLSQWLGGEDALDRAAQLNALWTGFITARQLIPLRQLAGDGVRPTQDWVARTTQALADGRDRDGGVAKIS
jgi:AcrR family transcriptional regulator